MLKEYESLDMALIEAEQLFAEQDFGACYNALKAIKDRDAYYLDAVPLLCSVMIELGKQGELDHMAHNLVEANPDAAVAWYAVGSYYFLIKKYPVARKYFDKAR